MANRISYDQAQLCSYVDVRNSDSDYFYKVIVDYPTSVANKMNLSEEMKKKLITLILETAYQHTCWANAGGTPKPAENWKVLRELGIRYEVFVSANSDGGNITFP